MKINEIVHFHAFMEFYGFHGLSEAMRNRLTAKGSSVFSVPKVAQASLLIRVIRG